MISRQNGQDVLLAEQGFACDPRAAALPRGQWPPDVILLGELCGKAALMDSSMIGRSEAAHDAVARARFRGFLRCARRVAGGVFDACAPCDADGDGGLMPIRNLRTARSPARVDAPRDAALLRAMRHCSRSAYADAPLRRRWALQCRCAARRRCTAKSMSGCDADAPLRSALRREAADRRRLPVKRCRCRCALRAPIAREQERTARAKCGSLCRTGARVTWGVPVTSRLRERHPLLSGFTLVVECRTSKRDGGASSSDLT
jgi:hypothetical protein